MLQHLLRRAKIIGSAQKSLQFRHQHALVKGLGNKIVRAQIHRHHHIQIVGGGGNENDRHLGYFSYFTAPMIAIEKRQRNIQQNDVRVKICEFRHHIAKIPHAPDLHIPQLRLRLDRLRNSHVVFHNP